MHVPLLDVLRCPLCENTLEVSSTIRGDGELIDGALQCRGCRHVFPVAGGVPDFLTGDHHHPTARAFSLQWSLTGRGWFERDTLYGYDVPAQVDWAFANCFRSVKSGEWLLDAGCGRGDQTIEIARRYPQAQVIGVDLTDTLPTSRAAAAGVPNVHFVRGDLLRPPIRVGAIDKAVSWGVLHHTPDTRAAFQALARTLHGAGELVVWLYPHPHDSDVFDMLYEMRDVHFLGRGHRIPKRLLLAILPVYALLSAPYFRLRFGNPLRDPRVVRSYLRLDRLPLLQKFRAAIFIYLDTLIPEFQDRPPRAHVERWFTECGFGPVSWDHVGLFWAARQQRAPAE